MMKSNGKKLWMTFASASALALGSLPAATILGSPTGLAGPHSTITFDEVGGMIQDQGVTSEYSAFGATFSGGFHWNNNLYGSDGSTGFAGANLSNIFSNGGAYEAGPIFTIRFGGPVSEAAFAFVDQGNSFTVDAMLGATVVESFSRFIPGNPPGDGFDGFTGIVFDSIRIQNDSNSAFAIDTLQFVPVPEPGIACFALAALGIVGCARRRHTRG